MESESWPGRGLAGPQLWGGALPVCILQTHEPQSENTLRLACPVEPGSGERVDRVGPRPAGPGEPRRVRRDVIW